MNLYNIPFIQESVFSVIDLLYQDQTSFTPRRYGILIMS